jgi:hypothetical protein
MANDMLFHVTYHFTLKIWASRIANYPAIANFSTDPLNSEVPR